MINALPATQASAMPAPRNAVGGGGDRAMTQNFARLLDRASGDGRNAASASAAPHNGGATAASAPAEAAAAKPAESAEHTTPQAPPRKGTAATGGERKPGPRNAARDAANAELTAPAQPDGLDSARPSLDAADAGTTRSARATPADSSSAPADPAFLAVPQAAAAPAADATACASPAAGKRPGAAMLAANADGTPLSMLQALQAAQADATAPATSTAASSRFGDALAAASDPALGAPEGRIDSQLAQAQSLVVLAALPGSAPTAAAPAPAVAEATLAAQPGSAAFASQLGAQITTFVRNGSLHAQLHLNPAEMGPVTVQIQLDGDSARVHMAAEHTLTRQALEQAMPLLASSLREAGLTLSGGGVFEQPRQSRSSDDSADNADSSKQRGGSAARQGDSGAGDEVAAIGRGASAPRRRGVVDLVA